MQKFSGYEETKVNNYGREKLELGGHICKILEVRIEEFESKKDGKKYSNLLLKIDIEKPDAQAGFYQKRFEEDVKDDATTAKWKGYYKVSIPNDDSSDFIKTNFKTFVTSVERSNPGYKWNWEENTLAGKLFGGVFGLEEFVASDGRVIAFTRCRFARNVEKIEEALIPKVKLSDGTYIDYDDYIEQKEEKDEALGKAIEENGTVEDDNSDLPF